MNIFKKNNIIVEDFVFSIKLILMLLSGCIFGLIRRLKFYPEIKFSIAEYISNKIGHEFNPEWVGCLLFIIACCILLILFMSKGFSFSDIINKFKRKSHTPNPSMLYQKHPKKKRK